MKSSVAFQLENAGWPALLLDGAMTICRANPAALRLFGPGLEAGTALLSAIWSPENTITPEQFFAQWERSPGPTATLKFRSKGGATGAWLSSICSFSREGQKFFLLQLSADNAGPDAQATESSLAQKQKLDCALQ